jgi:hypothetical protein
VLRNLGVDELAAFAVAFSPTDSTCHYHQHVMWVVGRAEKA